MQLVAVIEQDPHFGLHVTQLAPEAIKPLGHVAKQFVTLNKENPPEQVSQLTLVVHVKQGDSHKVHTPLGLLNMPTGQFLMQEF